MARVSSAIRYYSTILPVTPTRLFYVIEQFDVPFHWPGRNLRIDPIERDGDF